MNITTLTPDAIARIQKDFAGSIENLPETYNQLKKLSESDSIEILFYNPREDVLYDKVKGTRIKVSYLADDSILGHTFLTKKSYISQNVNDDPHFMMAIDNPFKIEVRSQLVIPTFFSGKIEGMLRFSKHKTVYRQDNLQGIKLVQHSFREIFLNERYLQSMEMQKNAFDLETMEVYRAIKSVKATFDMLMKHTDNPEMQKLLTAGISNADSVFRYLNPNLDNVSRVKSELRQLNKGKLSDGLRVLIADDVQMNVKILNSLLNGQQHVGEIRTASDGNETWDVVTQAQQAHSPFDVIFLDHHMPGKLGLEIAEALKSDTSNPTIIVSITNDPDAIKHKLNLYDHQLTKPFNKESMDEVLSMIQAKRPHKEAVNNG